MTNLHPDLRGDATEALATPATALAIGAHPDDIEFGAGGTLAKWARAGCLVTMVIVTDGSKGSWDADADPADLARRRSDEQRAAAELLGAGPPTMLGHVDGELVYDLALRQEIASVIRRHRPDVVLSHDPWRRYMLHPDHRATGWAAVDGVVAARDHLFYPEQIDAGLQHHRPGALLLWSADEPDHREDISSSFETKLESLLCHSSQIQTTMGGAAMADEARSAFVARLRARAHADGAPAGLDVAEAFKRLTP